jgi:hypothetical protein
MQDLCVEQELLFPWGKKIVKQPMLDVGFTVRKQMMMKKLEIEKRFGAGFTFPQQFRHCWRTEMMSKMLSLDEFGKQSTKVASMCKQGCNSFGVVKNLTSGLDIFVKYSLRLQKDIYGAGFSG